MGDLKGYLKEIHSDGGRKRMPPVLILAEILFLIMVIRNILNFTILIDPKDPSFRMVLLNLISLGICAVTTIMTVNGMMGMSSARPTCWRKIARSAFSLLFMAVYYNVLMEFGFIPHGIVMDNMVFLLMVIVVELIMFLPSVRRYYTPPMYRVPPMKEWIKYTLVAPLFAADGYELTYGDDGSYDDGTSSF